MKCYKLRLYPTKEIEDKMLHHLEHSRRVYNFMLEGLRIQRLMPNIDRAAIQHLNVVYKELYPEAKELYSSSLQYNCWRIFRQLKSLKSNKKSGRIVGMMKFKGRDFYNSFTYNSQGYKFTYCGGKYGILYLSKIGYIKLRVHREINGNIKNVIIKKEGSKWFASIVTDEEWGVIGIDLGIESFIFDSDGKRFDSPAIWKKYIDEERRVCQDLSRKKLGSSNRNKAKLKLQNLKSKITRCREDFLHKVSDYYASRYRVVVAEKLDIKAMVSKNNKKGKTIRKNILDNSWGKFLDMLDYKLKVRGGKLVKVNPKNTSKMCSKCGHIKLDLKLSDRIYKCDECGHEMIRDFNASINIKQRYLNSQELISVENESDSTDLIKSGEHRSKKQEAKSLA